VRLLALLVYGIFVPVALAGQASTPQPSLGTVQGQVLLEPGDQPMRKVNVVLSSSGGEREKFSATTDAGGRFKIGEVKPGAYKVRVFREGYFRDYQRERQSTIAVQPGESNRELVLYLQRCAVITGTIVDADGDPLRGVLVTATMALPRSRREADGVLGMVSTNDVGEFRVPDLIPMRYLISAVIPNMEDVESTEAKGGKKERNAYATTYYPGTLNREQAVPVEVQAGDEVAVRFGMLMTRVFRVRGIVTGLPAGSMGTRVVLTPKSSEAVEVDRESQTMETDGKFEFKNVVPGSYTARVVVEVNAAGERPSLQILRLSPAVEVNESNVEGVHFQPETSRTHSWKIPLGQWANHGLDAVGGTVNFCHGRRPATGLGNYIVRSAGPIRCGRLKLVEQGRGIRNEERARWNFPAGNRHTSEHAPGLFREVCERSRTGRSRQRFFCRSGYESGRGVQYERGDD
jgi:hypothetical protein